MIKISIIIPFYQTQKGILKKTIDSIFCQKIKPGIIIGIIIIDDESPAPVTDEIKHLPNINNIHVLSFRKSNGGPASARNFGLEIIDPDTNYVAFLDSDDSWEPDHILNAVNALDRGNDFYFSDFFQLKQNISAFDRANKINLDEHQAISNSSFLHSYSGDMINQIITGNIIGTSTVVIRWDIIREIRFREDFTCAGEDYLFWIEVCKRTQKIVFSSKSECRYGGGVNIYSGVKWGSTALLERAYNELKYRKVTLNELQLDLNQKTFLRRKIKLLRKDISKVIFHRLANRKSIPLRLTGKIAKIDWRAIILLPLNYF